MLISDIMNVIVSKKARYLK